VHRNKPQQNGFIGAFNGRQTFSPDCFAIACWALDELLKK